MRHLLAVSFGWAFCAAMVLGVGTASGASPPPWSTNTDCYQCHLATSPPEDRAVHLVDFEVAATAPVDRATACVKCHWEPFGSHPFHNSTWNCGSCHSGMGAVNPLAMPMVSTANGYFNTAAGASADPATLHIIHSNPTWAGTVTKNNRQCMSCHAAASCSACHENGVDPSHADHTWDQQLGEYWPGTGPSGAPFGGGTSVGNEAERTVDNGLTCSDPTCHVTPSGASAPALVEDNSPAIKYSAGGGWARGGTVGYTANSYYRSNYLNAKAELAFTGQKVDLISDVQQYRGFAKISIDGVQQAIVDLYSATPKKQQIAYSSGVLTSGNHTITVEVLRQKNPAARDYYVVVDAFWVYPKVTLDTAGCLDPCHDPDTYTGVPVNRSDGCTPVGIHPPPDGDIYGYIVTTSTVRPNVACLSECHVADIVVEHGETYTGPITCLDCHNDPIKDENTPWDGNCGSCHDGSGNPRAMHSVIGAAHDWAAESGATCGSGAGPDCHDVVNIARLHYNATTSTPEALDNCNVCHRSDAKPAGLLIGGAPATTCTDCHVGHTEFEPVPPITPISWECIACHNGIPPDGYAADLHPDCNTCHDNPSYPDIRQPGRNDCVECHNVIDMNKDYSPLAGHYAGTEASHTASFVQPQFTGELQCTDCHSLEMKPEHMDKPTSGGVTCAGCHTTPYYPGALWDGTCEDCHATGQAGVPHAGYAAAHDWSGTAVDCDVAGCHIVSDIGALHAPTVGCTACHDANGTATVTECADCHGAFVHPEPSHNASQALGMPVGSLPATYGYGTNVGCFGSTQTFGNAGCHFSDLRLEHGTTAYLRSWLESTTIVQRSMDGFRGSHADGCTVCHPAQGITPGTYASSTNVVAAVTNGDYRCVSCHDQPADNAAGVHRPHATTEVLGGSTPPTGTTIEFGDWSAVGGGGGHNSIGDPRYPVVLTGKTINGVTIVTNKTFQGTLVPPWTTSSVVRCADCHDQPATPPNGPHGGSVPFYLDGAKPALPLASHWYTDTLQGTTSPSVPAPCSKCHSVLSSAHVATSIHSGADFTCEKCHIRIPHAWKRPRLLRRMIAAGGVSTEPIDSMPYATSLTNALLAFKISAGATNFGQGANCRDNCRHSSATAPYWP